MKRLSFITIHIAYVLVLGYFFMFSLMHFASLNMQGDDDLNRAIGVGVFIWPILIAVAGWSGNALYKRISKHVKIGYLILSLFTGFVFADFILGHSFFIYEWDTKISVNLVVSIAAIVWFVFAILTAYITNRFLRKYFV